MADAAKPAAPAAKAKPGESGMDRREVLVLGAGWAAFTAAIGVSLGGLVRFLYPSVTFEPPQRFKVGFPGEFAEGVSEKFKAEYGVWIVRDSESIYALIAICTHLGCSPGWLAGEKKFKCPCHGSGFYSSGINFEGPAPRPLERCAIKIDDDGQLLVDKDRKFLHEADQWEDPASRVLYKA